MKKRKDGYYKRSFTANGKRYYVYARTKDEAEKKLYNKRRELERAKEERDNPIMDEYFRQWEDGRRGSVRENTRLSTLGRYKACADIFIPGSGRRFGSIRLKDVTADDIRHVMKVLNKSCKSTTVNATLITVKSMFYAAERERRICYNPAQFVARLKETEPQARDNIHRALTREETDIFLRRAKRTSFYYNLYRLALLTGCRFGELGALKISDISEKEINIKRTLTRNETGEVVIGDDTKTKSSRRTIPLNDDIRETIRAQLEMNMKIDGKNSSPDSLLFMSSRTRGIVMLANVDRDIDKICREAGIERFSIHAFRHTFATRAVTAGMPLKVVQSILGHASFAMTMDLYAHCLPDSRIEEMQKLHIL